MTTSVLALGNFARTDNHCIKMVDDQIMVKLMGILQKNIQPDADARLQHALVSSINFFSSLNLTKNPFHS
jgi:hypothetical protein